MAAFLDICRFLPTAGGTTDWTYAAAVQGYQGPAAAGAVNGRLYKYRAESADLTQWEVGEGGYTSSTGTLARTTILFTSAGTTAKINFAAPPQVAIVALKEDLVSIEEANGFTASQQAQARANLNAASIARTRSVISSGSGTYTTPAGCKTLLVRMVGGGGGGGGSANTSANAGAGGAGGNTTFGTSFLAANGGAGGSGSGGATSNGGVASGGDVNQTGSYGAASSGAGSGPQAALIGGAGAGSAFGGGTPGGWPNAGGLSATSFGAGGGGAGGPAAAAGYSGGGGASGGYCEKLIASPAASYAFAVGAGGTAGTAGSGGTTGSSGGSGVIIIDEFY
ncbi:MULTISPECIES: hypothetical protein [Bradyrhizobium]|jgi:hypothetical protein|uniref:hypothetical protein n=1 Tax=Bradyrhizobium TaxID=374 RepID=UPI00039D259F|nr:hypothetical protein [Bradyrhizobium denitrificans]MCL8485175.1 hypothetical protein [Bradyrhizobium denitrificans]RTM05073.1 MAG: hypothetical protein EKK32_04245 [Bradyrhizobiaceae bacterium]